MFDCSKEFEKFHREKITLGKTEQDQMRDHRNANRTRVESRLKEKDISILYFYKQGSYAMKTMIQHPLNMYDIDDGIYFDKEVLTGPQGGEKSALEARQMVCDALQDDRFNTPPEVKKNCVRIHYAGGYHVDMPVYRRISEIDQEGTTNTWFELASSEWVRSDARFVTKWFETEDTSQSPTEKPHQLRRVCRQIKKFAQSRESWKSQIASGFMITKLVTECFHPNAQRDDKAFYETIKAIWFRLQTNLEVDHPVTPGGKISKGVDDPKAKFLKEKIGEFLPVMDVLFGEKCSREEGLKAWDNFFYTDFFSQILEKERAVETPEVLTSGFLKQLGEEEPAKVDKPGGPHYA